MSPQANKIVDGLTKIAIALLVAGSLAAFSKFQTLEVNMATSRVIQDNMADHLIKLECKVDEIGRKQQDVLIELARIGVLNEDKED